jgi:hypothetical protein
MKPPKRPAQAIIGFRDSRAAIDGTLEEWLPRLLESNDAFEEALLTLRLLYLARQSAGEDIVLKQVQDALKKAEEAKSAFSWAGQPRALQVRNGSVPPVRPRDWSYCRYCHLGASSVTQAPRRVGRSQLAPAPAEPPANEFRKSSHKRLRSADR